MRTFLTITLVLAVVALSTIATASPAKCVYLFEVWNNTFQPANGFHVHSRRFTFQRPGIYLSVKEEIFH